jgi:thioesterase domain-containing protein
MTPDALTAYLHKEVPLTAAMQIRVLACTPHSVEIGAPLQPNINLHGTAFAGSLATLGLISGWTLLNAALRDAGIEAHLVAQKSECTFHAPGTDALRAIAKLPPQEWTQFLSALQGKGRARLTVVTEVRTADTLAVTHTGTYAAKLK